MMRVLSIAAYKRLFVIGICVLTTSLSFTLGADNRNLLLIILMAFSPLVLVLSPIVTKNDLQIYVTIFLMILFPLLNHPESMRWSTVLYSCMFCLYFISITHLYRFSNIKKNDILLLLKWLLYAYTLVLLIQQICIILGLPIFNISNYDASQPWKLNSLMSEPEHSARMVALLMYTYLSIKSSELKNNNIIESWRNDKLPWIAFLWCILTSFSAGAYLYLLLVLSKFLNLKNGFITFCLLLIIFTISNNVLNSEALNRFVKFSASILTFDIKEIYNADQSAALRIIPSILCIQHIDIFSINGWFGHGIDYVSGFMSDYLPGVEDGYTGGGLFLTAVEYGIIVFGAYSFITFKLCYDKNNKVPTILFWFFSVLLVGINSQLAWSTITLLYIAKSFK